MKLKYSSDAVEDLMRLREFIAEHDPVAAGRIAQRLVTGIRTLKAYPRLGHPVSRAPDPQSVRDLVLGSYVVRYVVFDTHILVLRVWHHKEQRD